jgi:hypothetical protein
MRRSILADSIFALAILVAPGAITNLAQAQTGHRLRTSRPKPGAFLASR